MSAPADHLRTTDSVVYFIGAPNGLVKIGFASDFDERLRRIVCGSPVPLEVLAWKPGGRPEENEYHARFKAQRQHGEWFERSPELEAEIQRLNEEVRASMGFPPARPRMRRNDLAACPGCLRTKNEELAA